MDNKELEELKEKQRQKIRELGQNRLIKSLENQLNSEREANHHLQEMSNTLNDLKKVVENWDEAYENTPEKKRSKFRIVDS